MLAIANPNPFPVTLTGVNLPSNQIYGGEFTTNALSTVQTGCTTSTGLVSWYFAAGTSDSAHTLTAALTIGASGNANNPLTVTMTNDASMALTSPAACEATFFSMPSMTGIAASGGAATATVTPVTDAWTS